MKRSQISIPLLYAIVHLLCKLPISTAGQIPEVSLHCLVIWQSRTRLFNHLPDLVSSIFKQRAVLPCARGCIEVRPQHQIHVNLYRAHLGVIVHLLVGVERLDHAAQFVRDSLSADVALGEGL